MADDDGEEEKGQITLEDFKKNHKRRKVLNSFLFLIFLYQEKWATQWGSGWMCPRCPGEGIPQL